MRQRNIDEFDTNERRVIRQVRGHHDITFNPQTGENNAGFQNELALAAIGENPIEMDLPDSGEEEMEDELQQTMDADEIARVYNRYGLSKKQRRRWGRAGSRESRVMRRLYHPSKYYYRAYPRNEESLNTYGKSYWSATPAQRAARASNQVVGRGRFNLVKGARQLRQIGRIMGTNRMTSDLARTGASVAAANLAMAGGVDGEGAYMGSSRGLGGRGSYSAPFVNDSSFVEAGSLFYKPHFSTDASTHDDGGLVISNQEYICNLYGCESGKSFESTSYTINPGLAEVFPMLSQFAANFERYEMIQCVFHFETQLDAGIIQSSTGQVGDVLMYSHSDPNQPELQNISEFQMNGGNSVRVTQGLACGVECDPAMLSGLPNAGINYVRTGPVEDTDEYDQAKIQVAVSNTPADLANQVIGKLFVSYTVRLIKPKIMSYLGRGQLADQFYTTGRCGQNSRPLSAYVIAPENEALSSYYEYPKDIHNNIGATVSVSGLNITIDGTTYTSAMKILLPAWYQGLLQVTIVTKTYQASGEPNDGEEYPREEEDVCNILSEGNITFPSMMKEIDTTTSGEPQIITSHKNVVSRSHDTHNRYEANITFTARVAPALTTDNVIYVSFYSTQNVDATVYGGTIVTLRTMNDFGAVGQQSLDDISW